ncbi:uroporphyrinogen-III synthase [Sulfitobacter sp. THAF37]|uniref:uroporphyrinogen-III synthase n=1 Tax=Sulfitobacter sp. THAF37 TaxID=2587855 RepID=UPI0012A8036C|nr:uroporphyrinogen-III synthase [Sulfitobacter sp. THAF37]QFT58301.1 uroporphyrinogen-III synthase [Sulfitobacter sp. THAF37]
MSKPVLLLTRPEDKSQAFFDGLTPDVTARATLIVSPLLDIVPTGEVPRLADAWGVVFTSAQAVRLAPEGQGRPAFCVGETTAETAAARGWEVRQVSATADDLLAELDGSQIGGPMVHLGGRHLRVDIARALRARGVEAISQTLYDQKLRPLSDAAQSALTGGAPVVAPLFSLRTATHLVAQAADLGRVHVAAISPAVASAVSDRNCAAVMTVARPTADEMRRSVEKLLSDGGLA